MGLFSQQTKPLKRISNIESCINESPRDLGTNLFIVPLLERTNSIQLNSSNVTKSENV